MNGNAVMDFGSTVLMVIGIVVVVLIVLIIVMSCFKIVPQANAYVIERLGAYKATWSVGFHM